MSAAAVVKQEGKPNDMIARVEADPAFGLSLEEIRSVLDPKLYIGRCPEQVERYANHCLEVALKVGTLQAEDINL